MNKPEKKASEGGAQADSGNPSNPEICGIIMPIAEFGNRSAKHWASMLDIVKRAITQSGLQARPVWENEAVDVIHERIIFNIFNDPVIVADVSCLNPNVMFEIGMRITLGKPIILIGDRETVSALPFDTKIIDHVSYDGALQFHDVEKFIDVLAEKIQKIKTASDDKTYHPFIQRMGPVQITAPSVEPVSEVKMLINKLNSIERVMARAQFSNRFSEINRDISARDGRVVRAGGREFRNIRSAIGGDFIRMSSRLPNLPDDLKMWVLNQPGVDKITFERANHGIWIDIFPKGDKELSPSTLAMFGGLIEDAELGEGFPPL